MALKLSFAYQKVGKCHFNCLPQVFLTLLSRPVLNIFRIFAKDLSDNHAIRCSRNIQEIKSTSYVITLEQLLDKLQAGRINKRGFEDFRPMEREMCDYIEELIIGIPLKPFYFAAVNQMATWKVIDGHKRLYTLNEFFNLKRMSVNMPHRLVGLSTGYYYSDLPFALRRRLLETEVVVHLLNGTFSYDEIVELHEIINKKS